MFKKTLISLAVASSVGLTGCFDSGETGANANPDYLIEDTTIDTSIVRPIYDPNPIAADPKFPINADLILLLGATQSANYDFTGLSGGTSPADDAVNDLSGFSTSGAFTLKFDGSLNPVSVQAGATVFLLPVNVADAVEGVPEALPNTNPSGIIQSNPFDLAAIPNFRADVVSVDGGSDNAIRIVPLEPLAEGQKYLVIATNNIVGADGQPIERSVQDVNLADGVLGNPALANVKSILQASDALANGFLAQAIPQDTPESALAYTFTTNSDTDVLRAMMAPAAFGNALGQKIGFTAQLKAVRDNYPTLNFSQLTTKLGEIAQLAADLQAGDIDPSDLDAQELAAIPALATVGPLTEPSDLQAAIGAEIGDTLHLPVPRPSFFGAAEPASDLATIQVLAAQAQQAGETNAIVEAALEVQVSEGAIALPYFQSLPGETGAGIVTGSWSGSTSLEEDLNENLAPGQTIFSFLRDIDGTLNVNGYFPFPQQNATTTVPVVVFQPDPGAQSCTDIPGPVNAAGSKGVTIFQHGITVDRSVSMLPAILLAESACQTVVAIDQPLHGLAGANAGTVAGLSPLNAEALTTDVETAIGLLDPNDPNQAAVIAQLNALISADYIGERHFGYTANASLQPVEAPLADISSGSLFINPLNMMNSRDNLRQGVVDLLNVAASIQTFDLNKDFAPGDLAGVPVNFIGHSLGGISGTVFASLANDTTLNTAVNDTYDAAGVPLSNFTFPTLGSVVLHNTSGQVTRLIENSPAFSGQVLGGLANAGVTQGTSDFESFFYVFQSISDAGDPVNFAKGLGASTSNLLVTEVVGDTTVPNEANVNPLSPAFSAPLTGTEPLMALLDLGAGGSNLADGNDLNLLQAGDTSGSPTPVAVFFDGSNPCTTANHGTFVAPIVPNEACGGAADTSAAFSVMVTQTARALSGLSVPATPSNIDALGTSPTLANALDQDEQAAP